MDFIETVDEEEEELYADDPIPRTMQAVVYRGVNDLRVETVPVPRCGAHEVLVKVAACGVCPTDIKKFSTAPCRSAHSWS